MADPPNHFFKFIQPGFKFNLSIPEEFLRKLKGSYSWRCKKAIVLTRGDEKWSVHINDGGVFGEGWKKFVTDNGVEEFDFIVFKHQGNMVFDCFVFDKSTCTERHYPNPNPNIFEEDVKESLTESSDHSLHIHKRSKKMSENNKYWSDSESKLDGDHCFVSIMSTYYIKEGRFNVPMKFARSNGLLTKTGDLQVVIVDEA